MPETAWIEHCKELLGAPPISIQPANPCPPEHQPAIRQALAHFGMLPKQ